MFARGATLSDADAFGGAFSAKRLHSDSLLCTEVSDQDVFSAPNTLLQGKTLPYPCPFNKSDEMPEMLDDICTGDF